MTSGMTEKRQVFQSENIDGKKSKTKYNKVTKNIKLFFFISTFFKNLKISHLNNMANHY